MIRIDLVGRLGNQMFQYAICRTIAEKNGYKFCISRDENDHGQNISNYFDLNMGVDDGSPVHFFFREDASKQNFNPKLLIAPDNTKLWGFFQTNKYFANNQEKVKEWFSVRMDDTTKSILEKNPVDQYCYVHFRGTDYKNWDCGTRFLPKKYFDDAMEYVKSKNPDIKFVVITDDIDAAKVYFPDCEVMSNNMMVDFKLLYYSKYCILTNSTFSWWAAWLSDKSLTIAPVRWLNYNMPEQGFYPNDINVDKFFYI